VEQPPTPAGLAEALRDAPRTPTLLIDAGASAPDDAADAGEAPLPTDGTEEGEASGARAFERNGKPALFVWSTSETEEAARAELAEFERMRAPWPELDGLNISPTWPRVVSLGPTEHLVVLGLCGPDAAPTFDRPLALVRLGRPGADLRAVDHQLGTKTSCPRASGAVFQLPEVALGKQTLAAAVVKRNRFGLTGPELNETWDSLTLAVLREQAADGGLAPTIVHSAMKDTRRCADPAAAVKKGALVLTQRCVAADCEEASSVWIATTTTSWTVKGKKLVPASKTTKRPGRRCDADDATLDP
jgi:hypothetical protein